jgi:hypothetical protein
VNWKGSENDGDSQYNDDSGNYGGDGTDTSGNANSDGETLSVTVTTKPSANGTANTTTSTETVAYAYQSPQGSGSDGGKQANQDAQPAAKAQPAANKQGKTFVFFVTGNKFEKATDFPPNMPPLVMQAWINAKLDGGGTAFTALRNKVNGSVIKEFGKSSAAKGLSAAQIKTKGANLVDEQIVAWDAKGHKQDPFPTDTVLGALDAKNVGSTVRVILVGYSYGATLAANEYVSLSKAIANLNMVPEIRLIIIDGVDSTVAAPNWEPLTAAKLTALGVNLKDVDNYHSTVAPDKEVPFKGGMGAAMPGANNVPIAVAHPAMIGKALSQSNIAQDLVDAELKDLP